MTRLLFATGIVVVSVRAQIIVPPPITLCPTLLPPANVQRLLTVTGSGFTTSTTASWQQQGANAAMPLAVQFVNSSLIRLVIPATIGTTGTSGTIRIMIGATLSTLSFSFAVTTTPVIVCSSELTEVTAGRDRFPVTIYGLGLGSLEAINGVMGTGQPLSSSPVSQVQGAGTYAVITMQPDWMSSPGELNFYVFGQSSARIVVNPLPVIGTTNPVRLFAGQTVMQNVSAVGGTVGSSALAWRIVNGPSWATINSTGLRTATLVISPPSDQSSSSMVLQLSATDNSPGQPAASAPLGVPTTVDALPDLTFTGIPGDNKLQPDQQYTMRFGTWRATPLRLSGQINLSSAGAAFVSGTSAVSTVPFDIAPNCVLPDPCSPSLTLRAGTVAGPATIAGTVTPIPGGLPAPPPISFPNHELIQDPALPQIDHPRVSTRRTSFGFEICVPGFSNTRQMNEAMFRFVPAQGRTISSSTASRAVDGEFAAWFTPNNAAAGGGFTLVQPVSVQGDINSIGQFYVTLRNSVGASAEVGPIDLAGAPPCNITF